MYEKEVYESLLYLRYLSTLFNNGDLFFGDTPLFVPNVPSNLALFQSTCTQFNYTTTSIEHLTHLQNTNAPISIHLPQLYRQVPLNPLNTFTLSHRRSASVCFKSNPFCIMRATAFVVPTALPPIRSSPRRLSRCPLRIPLPRTPLFRMTLADPASTSTQTFTTSVDVLIVGTGISGSSLAFNLHKYHPEIRTLTTEARAVVGGNVISCKQNGYVWEEGPNTFQPSEVIMRLAVDVGLKNDLVFADSTLPRFVYWDKNLFALPLGPQDIPKFRLLSLPGAIRAGLGALGFVLPPPPGEETIQQFITRHLGREVFEKMIDPFVSGVYAGDPSKLAMQSAFKKIFALTKLGGTQGILEGGIIRVGQKKRDREQNPPDDDLPTWKPGALGSFKDGLGMLPNAIKAQLGEKIKLEWRLVDLSREEGGMYIALFDTPEGRKQVLAKTIALTTPARATASVLKNLAPDVKVLEDVHYPTVWCVSLGYPKSEFKEPLRGFGNLIPRKLRIRTLGTIWSSCLFPGRAPEGMELLLSYIGGARDVAIKGLSEEEVVQAVHKDVKQILLKEDSNVQPVVVGARRWERAIPQYNLGHQLVLDKTLNALKKYDGLFLGGNYVHGVAFGDCISWGADTAPKIADFIKRFAQVEG